MARVAGSSGARTGHAIRRAALKLIYDRGYEGFGLRELAEKVGLQPASLYNHFASKQDLLHRLIADHMQALLAQTAERLAAAPAAPLAQLAVFTRNHLDYHIEKKHEVYVANFELRSLAPANLANIIALRRRYEAILIEILDAGCGVGVMGMADTHVAAYALLAMLTGACTWYKPEGRLTKEAMIELHLKMVFEGCAVRAPARLQPTPANDPQGFLTNAART